MGTGHQCVRWVRLFVVVAWGRLNQILDALLCDILTWHISHHHSRVLWVVIISLRLQIPLLLLYWVYESIVLLVKLCWQSWAVVIVCFRISPIRKFLIFIKVRQGVIEFLWLLRIKRLLEFYVVEYYLPPIDFADNPSGICILKQMMILPRSTVLLLLVDWDSCISFLMLFLKLLLAKLI